MDAQGYKLFVQHYELLVDKGLATIPDPKHVTFSPPAITTWSMRLGRNAVLLSDPAGRVNSLRGRGGRIRTADFLDPNQTRYQTALRPDDGRECLLFMEGIAKNRSLLGDR